MKWESGIELVTPAMAEEWIRNCNRNNRNPRPGTINKYAAVMLSGNWITSPDGIIFSDTGRLLQGQHRLLAMIKARVSLRLFIVRGVDESVFSVLDRGAQRSVSDVLGIDRRLAEVSRLGASICKKNSPIQLGTAQAADYQIAEVANFLESSHSEIIGAASATAKVFSSAPLRLAASVRMVISNEAQRQHILKTYRDLVTANVGELCPVAQAFLSSVISGRVKAGGGGLQYDLLARGWVVFDMRKANQTKIQITDAFQYSKAIGEIIAPDGLD